MIRKFIKRYFTSWWIPSAIFLVLLGISTAAAIENWKFLKVTGDKIFFVALSAFAGIIAATIWNFVKKRWAKGFANLVSIFICGGATYVAIYLIAISYMFGPSEDGFADNLTIPDDIEISEPDEEHFRVRNDNTADISDRFQQIIRKALSLPGNDEAKFAPSIPSLRKASSDHAEAFLKFVEASPYWHVFKDDGHRFAARRWSFGGEPQNELHGYISDFADDNRFQTRCLICLDRKQWSRYPVQRTEEGKSLIEPKMDLGNDLHESQVMIDCGGVWVEVFEQSNRPERRVTKATLAALEEEFARFLKDPQAAIAKAKTRSSELAGRRLDKDGHLFRLANGMQPGIYEVIYSLNPGEPGTIFLKAFEITQGTPLSVDRLKSNSETRMTWSENHEEKFNAKAGFTIYEGDWGQPYAARFEVWFQPDSGRSERKLAERNFKIEGWMR